jgi:L-alanine-DL-glutamate epimerase-like enolase superfamily enzyme
MEAISMRIKSIEIFKADLPLKDPVTPSFKLFGKSVHLKLANDVVVKIESDNDYVGYGSTSPVPAYNGMSQETILEVCKYLAPNLIGKDPFNLAMIHDQMDRAIIRADTAKCAIDLALYDLIGKSLGLPAYALMGGKRREDFYTTWTLPSGGAGPMWTHEETAMMARQKYDMGYRSFEVHLGSAPGAGFEKDLGRIAAIREACPDVTIDADAHRNWTVKEAIPAIRAMEKYNINWVEQPCDTLRQLAEVRGNVTAGVIADERCQNVEDVVEVVNLKAADAICLKPTKAGGLFKSHQMAIISERFGLAVRVDGVPGESKLSNTATAHVALILKQPVVCGVMQHARLEYDFVTSGGIQFKDGKVSLPDTPGLGCEVTEKPMVSIAYFK